MRNHYTPVRTAKIKKLTIPNSGEDVEKLNLTHYGYNVKWYNHSGRLLSSFLKISIGDFWFLVHHVGTLKVITPILTQRKAEKTKSMTSLIHERNPEHEANTENHSLPGGETTRGAGIR